MVVKTLAKRLVGDTALGMLEYYRSPELRKSWGGPFNAQEGRQEIFLDLVRRIRFSAIAETGTYRGTTTHFLHAASSLPVYTVESHARFYGYARCRFLWDRQVRVTRGDSVTFLMNLSTRPDLRGRRMFFYLDAHCDEGSPVREEIRILFEAWPDAVAMLDDFQVPGDDGYSFDVYANGEVLGLEYLRRPDLAAFFPSKRSDRETGMKRGCVVLAAAPDVIAQLGEVGSLALHPA